MSTFPGCPPPVLRCRQWTVPRIASSSALSWRGHPALITREFMRRCTGHSATSTITVRGGIFSIVPYWKSVSAWMSFPSPYSTKVLTQTFRMVKNAFATLMCSRGPAMFYAGDEFCNTQFGNNNAYCQDNRISWLDWKRLEEYREIHDTPRKY